MNYLCENKNYKKIATILTAKFQLKTFFSVMRSKKGFSSEQKPKTPTKIKKKKFGRRKKLHIRDFLKILDVTFFYFFQNLHFGWCF